MAQDTPSRKLDQYIVRFPDGMRDRLKEAAAKHGRSLNAEIVARLGYTLGSGVHFEPMTAERFDQLFDDETQDGEPVGPPSDPVEADMEREVSLAINAAVRKVMRAHGLKVRTAEHPEGEPDE